MDACGMDACGVIGGMRWSAVVARLSSNLRATSLCNERMLFCFPSSYFYKHNCFLVVFSFCLLLHAYVFVVVVFRLDLYL